MIHSSCHVSFIFSSTVKWIEENNAFILWTRGKRRVCVWEKCSLFFVWLFDICELQFGIVREVCCHLILVLRFGDLLSLGALQRLDLICGSLFWFVYNWYLVFVNLWFCIYVRELFGCIWDLGLWECLYTNLYYPKFVIVKFVRRRP